MTLHFIYSPGCSICLIAKEMTRRVLLDHPDITVEHIDIDLDRERAISLVDPADIEYDSIPIPYLELNGLTLREPTKFQQIRDLLDNAAAKNA